MAFIKCSGGGNWLKGAAVTQALSTSAQTTITFGFRPSYIAAMNSNGSTSAHGFIYNSSVSSTKFLVMTTTGNSFANLGGTTANFLNSITDTGCIMNKASSSRTYAFFAAG